MIETDDQTVADMAAMPRTNALIGGEGVDLRATRSSRSRECCPSRATFLTGRYAHNHGVRSIRPPFGGFGQLDGSETLAVWLRRAGYATGLVGKYLNGYGNGDPLLVPPGWTDFEGLLGRFTYRFYDYTMNVGGRLESPRGYQTDVITDRSLAFIRRRAGDAPFFLWDELRRPAHRPPARSRRPDAPRLDGSRRSATAAPSSARPCRGRPRSTRPTSPTSRPPIRRRPPLKQWQIAALAEIHRQRLASLLAVDEGVARIVETLRETGELGDTLLIFTSDNGFMAGQHRVAKGKVLPYEPSIRVPLLMRGPGLPRGERRRQLVWNGDLAPTILDAAGASAPFALDGALAARRRALTPAILLEGPPKRGTNGMPRFTGLRTDRYKYVEYVWGPVELYDLRRDPDELDNLAGSPALRGVQRGLARRLARLRSCAGAGCRR